MLITSDNNVDYTLLSNSKIWLWDDEIIKYHGYSIDGSILYNKNGIILAIYTSSISIDNIITKHKLQKAKIKIIDLNGLLVLPGLNDAHIHVGLLGESTYFVDLSSCYSIIDLLKQVQNHINKYPDLEWIQGVNWDQTKLGSYPTRYDLDTLQTTKPIFLWRVCWHIGVSNTIALQTCRIDMTPSAYLHTHIISGGSVDYDPNTHLIQGIFRENSVTLITSHIHQYKNIQLQEKFLLEGLNICLQNGLTSVQTNDENCYQAYINLDQKKMIKIRVFFTPTNQDIRTPVELGGIQHIVPFRARSLLLSTDTYDDSDDKALVQEEFIVNKVTTTTTTTTTPITTTTTTPTADSNNYDTNVVNTNHSYHPSMVTMERIKLFSDGSLGAETAALRTTTFTDNNNCSSSSSGSCNNNNSNADKNREDEIIDSVLQSSLDDNITANEDIDDKIVTNNTFEDQIITNNNITYTPSSSSSSSYTGILTYSNSKLYEEIAYITTSGYRLEIHTIGDAAAEQVINTIETYNNSTNIQIDRPILTHCQILGPDLLDRIKIYNMIANIQPSFVPTDMTWVTNRQLQESQLACAYIWRTMLYTYHLHVSGGSDAPVEHCSPFLGIHDAIYRRGRLNNNNSSNSNTTMIKNDIKDLNQTENLLNSTPNDIILDTNEQKFIPTTISTTTTTTTDDSYNHATKLFYNAILSSGDYSNNNDISNTPNFLTSTPYLYDRNTVFKSEECLSFSEALYLYTQGAAYACHSEHILGQIKIGYKADFTIVDPIILINYESLATIQPVLVIVDGQIIYENKDNNHIKDKYNIHSYVYVHVYDAVNNDGSSQSTYHSILNDSNRNEEVAMTISPIASPPLPPPPPTTTTTTNDVSIHINTTNTITRGPYIPGKNGRFSCACWLLGKTNCSNIL